MQLQVLVIVVEAEGVRPSFLSASYWHCIIQKHTYSLFFITLIRLLLSHPLCSYVHEKTNRHLKVIITSIPFRSMKSIFMLHRPKGYYSNTEFKGIMKTSGLINCSAAKENFWKVRWQVSLFLIRYHPNTVLPAGAHSLFRFPSMPHLLCCICTLFILFQGTWKYRLRLSEAFLLCLIEKVYASLKWGLAI